MNIPANLKYTKDHEWCKIDGNVATVGITDFAQGELGDIVYVEIETEGEEAIINNSRCTMAGKCAGGKGSCWKLEGRLIQGRISRQNQTCRQRQTPEQRTEN